MSEPSPTSLPLAEHVCIRGGRVIDPHRGLDEITDVVLKNGVIESVGPSTATDCMVIDARGKLVVPGMIDLHAHIYRGMSCYGVSPDRAGVMAGVAHVNDVGSVGWMTFPGFEHYIVRGSRTPVTCWPNMLSIGVPENWAMGATPFANETYYPELLAEHARAHPTVIRGVKVWVERGFMSHLDEQWRAFEAARKVTDLVPLNLYVHLGDLWPKHAGKPLIDLDRMITEVVERMRPGEVLGHCFTQFPGGLVNDQLKVSPAAKLATEKGILHEVGHGLNFSFERARRFLGEGLPVDIISSDLHGLMNAGKIKPTLGLATDPGNVLNWSMMGTMTKCLALGMSLTDVIRAASYTPARAIGIAGEKGSLTPGFAASISILELKPGKFKLVDSIGEHLAADYLFIPEYTITGRDLWRCEPFELPEFQNDYVANNPLAFAGSRATNTFPPATASR
jgi:dihydroorotase